MSSKFERTGPGLQLVILFALAFGFFLVYAVISVVLIFTKFGANIEMINHIVQNPKALPMLKFLQSLSSVMIFFLPALFFGLIADTKPFTYLGFTKGFGPMQFLLVIIIMLACLPMIGLTGQWNENVHLPHALHGLETWARNAESQAEQQTKLLLTTHSFSDYIINLIMVAILPGICEELFFRGVLQKLFIKWTKNITAGILISAAIFSFLHFEFLGFLPRMILGIMLGYIYVYTGSIWLAMLGHFINNGLDVTLLYLYQIGYIHTDPMKNSPVPLVLGLLSGVIVIGLFWFLKKYWYHPEIINE